MAKVKVNINGRKIELTEAQVEVLTQASTGFMWPIGTQKVTCRKPASLCLLVPKGERYDITDDGREAARQIKEAKRG